MDASTVFDAIVASLLDAARFNSQVEVAPAVILWTDSERQWEPLVPRLQERLPGLLVLGGYKPEKRTGPGIWLRCAVARKLPELEIPEGTVPIVYLPGISRQELRAVDDCAKELQPLAELQYRGVFWTQVSAKDWTVCAFLKSQHGGLGLDVARDKGTKAALLRALDRLVEQPVGQLRDRRIDEAYLNGLLSPDPVRDLLEWLNSPEHTRKMWPSDKWAAFAITCRQTYRFDPEADVPLAAAERLGGRAGAWRGAWDRFAAAPTLYPAVADWLRKARPAIKAGELEFIDDREPWPQDNEALEAELREALVHLANLPAAKAREAVAELEKSHAPRRGWPWAKFGWAPLACAMEPLSALAAGTGTSLAGRNLDALAKSYTEKGWQADAAALDALACVERAEDLAAVSGVVRCIYGPWLADGAACFQKHVAAAKGTGPICRNGPSGASHKSDPSPPDGCCLLFADGLRFDVGQRVLAEIAGRGWQLEPAWRWVPAPTVTATAKPAVSPVAGLLDGDPAEDEFRPRIRQDVGWTFLSDKQGKQGHSRGAAGKGGSETTDKNVHPTGTLAGKTLTHDRFKRLLADQGVQFLAEGETGDPKGRAWTECGSIDRTGHKEGAKLARRIGEEVRAMADRIRQLLDSGWKEVCVVTDHGWLLLPGGLPKVEMPKYLTETRWGRCAIVRDGSHVDVPQVPWGWNPQVHVAVATGIGAFRAGLEYDHGGLSLQECLVPAFTVRRTTAEAGGKIESLAWRGLRCRIEVSGAGAGWRVDLRTAAGDADSTLTAPQTVEEGRAALLVEDDGHIGKPAVVVLLAPDGQVVAKRSTLVGGES